MHYSYLKILTYNGWELRKSFLGNWFQITKLSEYYVYFRYENSSSLGRLCIVTPKIPSGLWVELRSFGCNCKKLCFPKKLSIKIERNNYWNLKFLCWKSASKYYSYSFHEIYKIKTFKYEWFFFESFPTLKFLTPKIRKIRCYLRIFKFVESDFLTKLTMHRSILTHRFGSVSAL
jgi:hypothetical protein